MESEHRKEMENKDVRMPSSLTWVIVVIITVALVVTFGIGMALGGAWNDKVMIDNDQTGECQTTPTKSPLYHEPSTSQEDSYSTAAVATDTSGCSKVGSNMMEIHGASAMDGAIAAIFCLGVIHPHRSGIGGGHFITYYNRTSKEVYTVNGREQAPSKATDDMFTEAKNTSSVTGGMSIGVPGEVLGLYEAWKMGGLLPWKALVIPAVHLCQVGFPVRPSFLKAIDRTNKQEYFDQVPTFRDFITNPKTGEIYKKGDTMYCPKLAKTLMLIADDPYAFYNGSLATDIALDIADAGGIITKDDLASYTARVKPAIRFHLNDNMTVYSPPPPSGGAVYQYILNILKGYHMDHTSVSTVDKALETYHRITEGFKHAFSLRSELGDCDVETEAFKEYARQLVTNMTDPSFGELTRALINDTHTFDHAHYKPKYANAWDHGSTHLSVVGRNGEAVSITSTLNMYFGSKVIGNRTGIVFNNEMDDFSTPGTVNAFGIPASQANFVLPGKRPLSSMSPSIVVDGHGDVKLVVGASGGPRIITSSALVTIEALWFDWGIKEAIDYPRIHHQLFPEELVQYGFPKVLVDGLRRMGHTVVDSEPFTTGYVHGILRTGGTLYANSDYRTGGKTHGYI